MSPARMDPAYVRRMATAASVASVNPTVESQSLRPARIRTAHGSDHSVDTSWPQSETQRGTR